MAIAEDYEDLDRSLAQRRGRCEHRQLPKRYRDVLPEPPSSCLRADGYSDRVTTRHSSTSSASGIIPCTFSSQTERY